MKASDFRAIDFFNELTSRYARRWFVGALVVLFIVSLICYGLASLLDQLWLEGFLQTLFTEIAAGSAIILMFYSFYLYFIGPRTPSSEVTVVRSQDIGECLKELVSGTRRYEFGGEPGPFFGLSHYRPYRCRQRKTGARYPWSFSFRILTTRS